MAGRVTIRKATGAADMARARKLFADYQSQLGVDLSFQGFDAEIDGLPGAYALPAGCLLLAIDGGEAVGCVGMRPLEDTDICEMKRLFVYERWRDRGLGRRLAVAVIDEARAAGYTRMRLDTLEFMAEARALYRGLGFRECAPYYDNPLPNVLYMEIDLAAAKTADA